MRRLMQLGGTVAATVLLVAATPSAVVSAAEPSGRCPAGEGVTVVVDYGPLGGGVEIGCDLSGAGKPASVVVPEAGFTLSYVTNEPGFVCAVEQRPEPGGSCHRTPPSTAYWGLFWSDGTPATWTYSSEGARTLDVGRGGSIGWRFQNGGELEQPGAAPTAAKPKSAPAPAPKPSSTPKPSPTQSPTTRPARVTSPATQSPSSSAPVAESGATAAAGGAKSSVPKSDAADESKPANQRRERERRDRDDRPQQEAQEDRESVTTSADEVYEANEPVTEPVAPASATDGGGAPTTVVALLLLAGLGTAAALVARRRRAS